MRQRWRRKPNHSRTHLPRGESQGFQKSVGRAVLPIQGRLLLPQPHTALPGRGERGPTSGWKWGGGMGWHAPSAPQSCPCPDVVPCWADHGALGHCPVLGPQLGIPLLPHSPFWHRYWSVPYSPEILPPFFCSNCLNLIVSSSAHHSSLFDDTNQVVGGFVMAVSDTLQAPFTGGSVVRSNFGFVGNRLEAVLLVGCALISVRQQHVVSRDS